MGLSFRPHHFLCALCFKGSGYSPAFIHNFQTIMATLQGDQGDQTPITIVDHTDAICQPCPNRLGLGCATQEKISRLDKAHADALGFQPNQTITWGEAKQHIQQQLSLEKFHQICDTCSWKSYGICEGVLTPLLGNNDNEGCG